jgi:hypothetical protein
VTLTRAARANVTASPFTQLDATFALTTHWSSRARESTKSLTLGHRPGRVRDYDDLIDPKRLPAASPPRP